MKYFISPILAIILFLSCNQKHETHIPISPEQETTNYLRQEFKSFYRKSQYAYRRKTFELSPGNYKMLYYEDQLMHDYNPFAVRFTTKDDSLLTYFSFTDELFYNHNDINGSLSYNKNNIETHTTDYNQDNITQYITLEKNLNKLIQTLGYQNNKNAISNLIQLMFRDMIGMKKTSHYEIEWLYFQVKDIQSTNPHILKCIDDYTFMAALGGGPLYNTKDGNFGYWYFDIIEQKDSYYVKTRFLGDLLYSCFYI